MPRPSPRRRSPALRWTLALALLAGVTTPAGAASGPSLPPPAAVGDVRLATRPDLSRLRTPTDEVARLLRSALTRSNKYALGTWWEEYMAGAQAYHDAGTRAGEKQTIDSEEVRRYSSVAYGLSASLATGAYRADVTGVPEHVARLRVADLVHYVASLHRANVQHTVGWGESVQAALWSSQAALAGWLLDDGLPPSTQVLVGRMLAHEADVVSARRLHYYRDRQGRVLTPGNSGAEELAWDGVALWTAVELLPHHERRSTWASAAYRRFVGAYARPADVGSTRMVNGRAVASWLGGSNAEANGFVVNHHKLNPDYTTDIAIWGAAVSGLTDGSVPAAMLEGMDRTYLALATHRFPSPPYRAPGGPAFRPGHPDVYYPTGPDWGPDRHVVYGSLDAQTAALSRDPRVGLKATGYARLRLREVEKMQARFPTGQIYGPRSEDVYRAREEHAAMLLGNAYLTWWLAHNDRFDIDRAPAEQKRAQP